MIQALIEGINKSLKEIQETNKPTGEGNELNHPRPESGNRRNKENTVLEMEDRGK